MSICTTRFLQVRDAYQYSSRDGKKVSQEALEVGRETVNSVKYMKDTEEVELIMFSK